MMAGEKVVSLPPKTGTSSLMLPSSISLPNLKLIPDEPSSF